MAESYSVLVNGARFMGDIATRGVAERIATEQQAQREGVVIEVVEEESDG